MDKLLDTQGLVHFSSEWRRAWDSNPRDGLAVYTISRLVLRDRSEEIDLLYQALEALIEYSELEDSELDLFGEEAMMGFLMLPIYFLWGLITGNWN